MLSIEALDVRLGTTDILRQVGLNVPDGSLCGLIGRNGAGKTTLIRAAMGLIPARAGSVNVDGQELLGQPAFARARLGVGYMPEDRRLVPDFSVRENVLVPAWATGQEQVPERLEWVYGLIPEVRQFAARRANQLSGGQQKLVALARALMTGRRLLLLDEPFEGVAPVLAARLAVVLQGLKSEGLTILLAESNERHVESLLTRLFVIERGTVRSK